MPSRNDITGDTLVSKKSSTAYRDNWDRIFKKEDLDSTLADQIREEIDRNFLSSIYKVSFIQNHSKEVKRVFDALYPETKLSDEQIELIVLMWEEQVKEKQNED